MDNMNGATSTVNLSTASPSGNVPSTGMSELPRDVSVHPSSAHDIQEVYRYEPERVQATDTQKWFLYALATLVVLGFFGLTVLMMMSNMDPNNSYKDIVFMMFGALVTGFSMVLAYFFGSSAGSAQKSVELAQIAKKG